MKKQLSLMKLLKIVMKFWYIPVILAVVGGVVSRSYAQKKYQPIYTAESTLIVKQKHESSHYLKLQVDGELSLIPTYQSFINSDKVMTKVHQKLKNAGASRTSVSNLQKNIELTTSSDSLIMTIKSMNRNKKDAVKQVNTVAKVFGSEISTVSTTSKVVVMTKAKNEKVKVSTFSGLKPIFYGLIVGGIIGVLIELVIGLLLQRKVG